MPGIVVAIAMVLSELQPHYRRSAVSLHQPLHSDPVDLQQLDENHQLSIKWLEQ
jgi:hypothetical protein